MSKVASAVRQPILKWTDRKFDIQKFLKSECRNQSPLYTTELGSLYATDCMNLLPLIKDEVVDTVFADPPFNLGKQYGENTDDNLPSAHYVQWCNKWLYSKGKPKTFHRIRTPILTCRHCGGEIKDNGGHRGAMNPKGVTLKDVWSDIPPRAALEIQIEESSRQCTFNEAPR